jgi:hypothetical protein
MSQLLSVLEDIKNNFISKFFVAKNLKINNFLHKIKKNGY